MISIYTATHSDYLKDVVVNVEYPENELSPREQIAWLEEHYKYDISIKTFSPYILNYMNVILRREKVRTKTGSRLYHGPDEYNSKSDYLPIDVVMDDGIVAIDTYDFAEVMSDIHDLYQRAKDSQ